MHIETLGDAQGLRITFPDSQIPAIELQVLASFLGGSKQKRSTVPGHPVGEMDPAHGGMLLARGMEGSVLRIGLEAESPGPGVVDLDLSAQVQSIGAERAVRTTLRVCAAGLAKDWKILVPGIWYMGNPHTAARAPSARVSDSWTFRDDRPSIPSVLLYSPEAKTGVLLARRTPAVCDHEPSPNRGRKHAGDLIVDPPPEGTDVGAVGFGVEHGEAFVLAQTPYAEIPRSHQEKVSLTDPVLAYYRLAESRSWSTGYRVIVFQAEDMTRALSRAWRSWFDLYSPRPVPLADRSVDSMKASMVRFLESRFFKASNARSVSGFYTFGRTFENRVSVPLCEPAFTGKAFWHALHLIEYGAASGDDDLVSKAESVFDTWLTNGTRDGILCDFWLKSLLPPRFPIRFRVDRPVTFEPPRITVHNRSFSTRRFAESLEALVRACRWKPEKENWPTQAKRMLDVLVGLQAPDGSFARRYAFGSREPIEPENTGATPTAVAPPWVQ